LAQDGLAVDHIGAAPAWHLAPYVSVWAVASRSGPDRRQWWVVCGDLPTDCISAASGSSPRDALLAFAARWSTAASHMVRGESPSGFTIGPVSEASTLAPMLASRAESLQEMAADPELWE